jgi:cysteinylglycine-S-conjugate dipeptidase
MNNWTDEMHAKWVDTVSRWISYKAIEDNPAGLKHSSDDLIQWMKDIGFNIETYSDPAAPYRPIIVATKPPKNDNDWIGFFHHYDVEPVNEEGWGTDPWKATLVDGFLYGRGIADNIGPLAQRLIILEQDLPELGLLFVIQGEEEIGSPWAHEIYPKLELPDVEIWIDETGYFYKNGDQRILSVGESELLDQITQRLFIQNHSVGRGTRIRNRVMTKAFGENKCPCIAHLLKGAPYLAIGPNDDSVRVHGDNEGMDTSLLALSATHIQIVFEEAMI